MLYNKLAPILAFAAVGVLANPKPKPAQAQNAGSADDSLTLDPEVISTGFFTDGTFSVGEEAGEVPSLTSRNNYINFCKGKELQNGLQKSQGSCATVPYGDIPAEDLMPSTIFVDPVNGQQIPSDTTFSISIQVANLIPGNFVNADSNYYTAPQGLQGGVIMGHSHIACQVIDPKSTQPPPANKFSFFKGLNDVGNGKGLLTANVTGGLPAGTHRCCSLTSSANHAPPILPVAQRASADDCIRIVLTGNGNTENTAANDGSGGIAAASEVQLAIEAATNSALAASFSESVAAGTNTAVAAANTDAASATGGKGGKGSNNGKGGSSAAASSADTTSAANAAATTAATNSKGAKGFGGGKGSGSRAAGASSQTTAAAAAEATSSSAAAQDSGSKAAGGSGFQRGNGFGDKGSGSQGGANSSGSAAAASSTGSASGHGGSNGEHGSGKRFGKGRKQRFMRREFIA